MIKIYFKTIIYFFKVMLSLHKHKEFYNKTEGSTNKFKLFAKQYNKAYKYEKAGKQDASKTVQYTMCIAKAFEAHKEAEEKNEALFETTVLLTLWYIHRTSNESNQSE